MSHSSRLFHKILSFFVLCLLFPNLSTAQGLEKNNKVSQALSKMTLDQKVGQLFILGFPQNELTPELSVFISRQKPGAFLFFKRNIKGLNEVRKFNSQLSDLSLKYSRTLPLIAIDQEGGQVVRLATNPPMPNAFSVGLARSAEISEALGQESARLLKSVGFNMNLAPVLDVANPLEFSFIGNRSYGNDPANVAEMGYAFSKGHILEAVIPTAKHFPGTGSQQLDPHKGHAASASSYKELITNDLPPFQKFAELGPFSAVMLSHSSYSGLDPSNRPAVFSKKITQDLLRNELRFRGLIITDDLQMSASKMLYTSQQAALEALKSGSDMIMLTWSFKEQARAIAHVKAAVKSGELSLQSLNEKVARILFVKQQLHATNSQISFRSNVANSRRLLEIDRLILEKNFSRQARAIAATSRVCIASTSNDFFKSISNKISYSKILILDNKTFRNPSQESISKCSSLIVFVNNRLSAKFVDQLSSLQKSKTTVANITNAHMVRNRESFYQVIDLGFAHKDISKKIAQLLQKNYAIKK